jgi:dTDP-4-amino-4,6-dideoxygalactose transaminase
MLPITRPSIDEETIAAVGEVLRSGWITSGPKVQAFEAALSEICGGRPVRAFNSGTATLEVALRLAGVGPGDEVISTPLTWVATANVILEVGATPVLVDIDPLTRNIDLEQLEAAITPRTRALLPVDLAGLPVDRDRLYAIAKRHRLRVVEDAAQSFGASWKGQAIGSIGDFVSFSFHANKNLTTGEGGALVLPADIDLGLCERRRLQGVKRAADGTMDVDVLGGKFNLTDLRRRGRPRPAPAPAGIHRATSRAGAALLCGDRAGARPDLAVADFSNCNWHMFQPLLPAGSDRGAFIAAMKEEGIGIGVHYPPLHLFSLYRELGFQAGQFPQAEDVGARTVTLPLFPAMSDGDVERVCTALNRTLKI